MQKTDKLISANALLEKVQFRIDAPGIIGSTVRDMVATTRRIIEEAPAVDAVVVVRCCRCEYWKQCGGGTLGRCSRAMNYVSADHFCANGKSKGGCA